MSARRGWSDSLADMLHATSEDSVRSASVDWVARSLHAEGVPDDDQLAERLVGAAEHFHVPIELLITWIHDRYAGKEWTIERWARWCQKYADARKRLETEYAADRVEPARRKELPH
ncbi:MAG TPA: hypothetical protein VN240_07020 [Propylenella sp.]|nr:hypothetical protein [Propylenella sp.]